MTLFNAFCHSKEKFYKEEGKRNPWGEDTNNDYMSFGLSDKNLEIVNILLGYLFEQKLITKIPIIEELFIKGALDFTEK